MAEWWNQDWTAQSGNKFLKQTGAAQDCLIVNFRNALALRADRVGELSGVVAALSPGDKVCLGLLPPGGGGAIDVAGLAQLRECAINTVATWYVRKFNDDWSDYSPEGLGFLASDKSPVTINSGDAANDGPYIPVQIDGAAFKFNADFESGHEPYDFAPVLRKWRREIYTLSQAGSDGQRARFAVYRGLFHRKFFNDDADGALWNTYVTTPSDEEQHSTLFFEHDGTSWNLSDDQISPADVVTEQTAGWEGYFDADGDYIAHTRGFYNPGQIVDGDLLNNIRDYINSLGRTYGAGIPNGDTDHYLCALSSVTAGLVWKSGTAAERTGSSNTSQAAAESDFTASTFTPGSDQTGALGASTTQLFSLSPKYQLRRDTTKVEFPLTVWSSDDSYQPVQNPDSIEREISVWLCSQPTTLDGYNVFDDYGDPVIVGWHEYGTRVTNSDATFITAQIGALTIPTPWSDTPVEDTKEKTARGYDVFDAAVIFDWASSTNGFAFSRLTPT